jgi:hypothetical protein
LNPENTKAACPGHGGSGLETNNQPSERVEWGNSRIAAELQARLGFSHVDQLATLLVSSEPSWCPFDQIGSARVSRLIALLDWDAAFDLIAEVPQHKDDILSELSKFWRSGLDRAGEIAVGCSNVAGHA